MKHMAFSQRQLKLSEVAIEDVNFYIVPIIDYVVVTIKFL